MRVIAVFADASTVYYFNKHWYLEAIDNDTPPDKYIGRFKNILHKMKMKNNATAIYD